MLDKKSTFEHLESYKLPVLTLRPHLVLVAGALAVLRQALHSLVDESHVLLVDVESQQAQSARGAATDTVQELEGLTHQVVVSLVVLVAQKVLESEHETSLV